ncbi:hypothetical protein [Thermomonospora catenispora]|uniref:hypothetical protein n=1 Tax=Thermomonospora catenispora TaxID=2493090 RepID=UPI00111D85A6|nr:hypothetical protein [Thermomonospora catenispora]TNY37814.1 hypothetical protein EIO00_06575 [Thermomonospora catenispora]
MRNEGWSITWRIGRVRWAIAWMVLTLTVGGTFLVLGTVEAWAGLRVERGEGVKGRFVASDWHCPRICHWRGQWIPDDGTPERSAELFGYGEDDLTPGQTVPAIDPGGVGPSVHPPGRYARWGGVVPTLLFGSFLTCGGLYGLWTRCRELRSLRRDRRLIEADDRSPDPPAAVPDPPPAVPEETPVRDGRPRRRSGVRWTHAAGAVTAGILLTAVRARRSRRGAGE